MTKPTTHRWAVDLVERGIARIEEDGMRMFSVPAHLLPAPVTEGQLLRVTRAGADDGAVVITISPDPEATTQALKKSKSTMQDALKASRKRDKGGDVRL